jgi:hypothetical protein
MRRNARISSVVRDVEVPDVAFHTILCISLGDISAIRCATAQSGGRGVVEGRLSSPP